LKSTTMAEISRSDPRNFSPTSEFKQVALQEEAKKLKRSEPRDCSTGKRRILRKGFTMKYLKYVAMLAVLMVPLAFAQAQVGVGIGIGVGPGYVAGPPVCDYGYYSYYPYACAPYGYYGPSWFANGIFIGAGPWYHGWGGGWGHAYYGRGFYGREGYGHGYVGGHGYVARGGEGFHGGAVRGGESHGGSFHGGGGHSGGGHGGRR
jgi:hypothetical protein